MNNLHLRTLIREMAQNVLLEIRHQSQLITSVDSTFGTIYGLPDGRRACMPSLSKQELYFVDGPRNDVVDKSISPNDIDIFYGAVELRAKTVANIMAANLKSMDSRQGSVTLSINNDKELELSNNWVNHLLKSLSQ